jgi:hypothetical protein
MKKTSLDATWELLFDKFNILDEINKNGYFIISADQIKTVKEPRLVTKFDHSINLPQLFKRHKISILPITRSSYLLSNHEMFFEFENITDYVEERSLPPSLESITKDSITSEAIALNSTYISGMLEDFLEDENIYPTVSGRMGSSKFSFNIFNKKTGVKNKVDISNSQIEIDGAYEGDKFLTLLEAKSHISSDFLIRQIYYPYRLWKERVSKDIKLVYMVYSNSIFTFYEYKFKDPNDYNSLFLVKQKKYTLESTIINLEDIQEILDNSDIIDEPDIPFPQADDFRKVINLCELAYYNDLTKEQIASEYEFNIRQSDYYANAGKYLGLMYKEKNQGETIIRLTKDGQKMLQMPYISRQKFLIQRILSHHIFNDVLKFSLNAGKVLTTREILEIMPNYSLYKMGEKKENATTFRRRASSIRGWISWMIDLIDE